MKTNTPELSVGVLFALALNACDECEVDEDCARIEICAYFESGASECLPRCTSNADCGRNGAVCMEKVSSCDPCEDVLMVCDVPDVTLARLLRRNTAWRIRQSTNLGARCRATTCYPMPLDS